MATRFSSLRPRLWSLRRPITARRPDIITGLDLIATAGSPSGIDDTAFVLAFDSPGVAPGLDAFLPPLRRDLEPETSNPDPALSLAVAQAEPADQDALAREHLVPDIPPWRWQPWALAGAIWLHLIILGLFLLFLLLFKPPPQPEPSPPAMDVVFDNGGANQTAAPPAPLHGPTSPATAPPPAAPPAPPPPQAEPEVNLDMPPMPFADIQSAPIPSPPAPPQPAPPPRPQPRPTPPQHYTMMNGMSFGNGTAQATPSPPVPKALPGVDFSLPESDAQAATASDLTVKGEIGADWMSALNKWVNEHKYYPQAALEQNQQGDVQVEFTVDRAGDVTGLRLLSGSGSPFLDQAWLGLFQDNQLPPFPPHTKSDTVTVDATMHFELVQ